jgi:hypothetical protein
MNPNYLEIDGRYYAINMDKVIEFVSESENSVQTISQNYGIPIMSDGTTGHDITLISKEVSEQKERVSETMSNVRYSLLTYLFNLLLSPLSDGNGNLIVAETMKTLHLGQVVAFNTLFEMGIIYEIENNE